MDYSCHGAHRLLKVRFVTGHVHNASNRRQQNELLDEAIFEAERLQDFFRFAGSPIFQF
jgi:hypothetical protein